MTWALWLAGAAVAVAGATWAATRVDDYLDRRDDRRPGLLPPADNDWCRRDGL